MVSPFAFAIKSQRMHGHLLACPSLIADPPSLILRRNLAACRSILHLHIFLLLAIRLALNPENVVTSDQDLSESGGVLLVNVLLGVGELDVHVAVG